MRVLKSSRVLWELQKRPQERIQAREHLEEQREQAFKGPSWLNLLVGNFADTQALGPAFPNFYLTLGFLISIILELRISPEIAYTGWSFGWYRSRIRL